MNNNICNLSKFKEYVLKTVTEPIKKFFNSNNVKITVSLSNTVIITVRYNSNVDSSKIAYLYDLNNHSNGFFIFKPNNIKDIVQHDISFKHINIGFYSNDLFYKLGALIGIFSNIVNSSVLDFINRDKNRDTFILSINKKKWYNREIKSSDLKLLNNSDLKQLDKIAVNYNIEYPIRYTSFIKNNWINKVNNPANDKYLKKDIKYCEIIKLELIKIINIKKANTEPLDIYNIKDYKELDYKDDFYRSFYDLKTLYDELGLEPLSWSFESYYNFRDSVSKSRELIRLLTL